MSDKDINDVVENATDDERKQALEHTADIAASKTMRKIMRTEEVAVGDSPKLPEDAEIIGTEYKGRRGAGVGPGKSYVKIIYLEPQ